MCLPCASETNARPLKFVEANHRVACSECGIGNDPVKPIPWFRTRRFPTVHSRNPTGFSVNQQVSPGGKPHEVGLKQFGGFHPGLRHGLFRRFGAKALNRCSYPSRGTFHFHSFQGSESLQETTKKQGKRIRFLKRTIAVQETIQKSGGNPPVFKKNDG